VKMMTLASKLSCPFGSTVSFPQALGLRSTWKLFWKFFRRSQLTMNVNQDFKLCLKFKLNT
jgi:hypothetical protein